MTKAEQIAAVALCFRSPSHFIRHHVQIYDATVREWIPFVLWTEQRTTLQAIIDERLIIILKARQLGLTWLVLAYALWLMLFRPAATVLLFSRRDDEAVHLLTDRLKEMYRRLPDWLRTGLVAVEDSAHEWQLSNGSVARAFPTTAGDTYTASLAIVDEADLVPDLNELMNKVKPTIDGGGQMILLSRANKHTPESEFKRIYRGAKQGLNSWVSIFLPWNVRPERDQAWYERQKADVLARTGALDDLHQQYPATDLEALAPRTLDKRIAPPWLQQCFDEQQAIDTKDKAPSLPALAIYRMPEKGKRYIIGVDPAEGNPTSDPSALTVLESDSGEEAAVLAGKFQPSTTAAHADAIGRFYNKASLMVERNNHGHAVLLWLRDNSLLRLLRGWDRKTGWLSNSKGKTLMYTITADAFRDGTTIVHSFPTYVQLSSIDGSTLRAPEGQHDDLADSYALALCGVEQPKGVLFA